MLVRFDSSAITYQARFWVDDYETDEIARGEVRAVTRDAAIAAVPATLMARMKKFLRMA